MRLGYLGRDVEVALINSEQYLVAACDKHSPAKDRENVSSLDSDHRIDYSNHRVYVCTGTL
jgi:hypothetical protein